MPKDDDDDLLDRVTDMADRLKLEGKERQTYIHEHMTRGGYKAEPTYVRRDDDDDDGDDDNSGFFAQNRRRGRRDDDRRSRTRPRGGDPWYE